MMSESMILPEIETAEDGIGFSAEINHESGVLLTEEGVHHLAGLRQEALLAHEHIDRDDDADHQAEHSASKVHGIIQDMGHRGEHQVIHLIDDIFHRLLHGTYHLWRHTFHRHQMGHPVQQMLERIHIAAQITEDIADAGEDLREYQRREEVEHHAGSQIGENDRQTPAGGWIDGIVGQPGEELLIEEHIDGIEQVGDHKAKDKGPQRHQSCTDPIPDILIVLNTIEEQDSKYQHQNGVNRNGSITPIPFNFHTFHSLGKPILPEQLPIPNLTTAIILDIQTKFHKILVKSFYSESSDHSSYLAASSCCSCSMRLAASVSFS